MNEKELYDHTVSPTASKQLLDVGIFVDSIFLWAYEDVWLKWIKLYHILDNNARLEKMVDLILKEMTKTNLVNVPTVLISDGVVFLLRRLYRKLDMTEPPEIANLLYDDNPWIFDNLAIAKIAETVAIKCFMQRLEDEDTQLLRDFLLVVQV